MHYSILILAFIASSLVHVVFTVNYNKYSDATSMLSKSINLDFVDDSDDPISYADKLSIFSKPSKPCFFFCKFNFFP